jgi:hypothetical protein
MTDLEVLRSRIPGYADYADDTARHEVDKQMRAFLGESLAAVRDRLKPQGALAERLDGLLMRCEFTDQRVIRAADHARFDQALVDRVHALDRQLLGCADAMRTIGTAEELAAQLDVAARCLDERFGAIADAPPR